MFTSWLLAHLALIVGFGFAIVLTSHIIVQKRSPSATIAWLLVILLLPYVGVPLYLVLGGRKVRLRADRKDSLSLYTEQESPLGQSGPIGRLLRGYNIPDAQTGNDLKLCHTGEETYAQLIELIDGASHTLHLATYVFQKDEVGKDILNRLTLKASQGLEVRLLLDGVGSLHTHRRFFRPLIEAGGRVAYFMPVLHRPFRGRTNLRNHRKIAIADDSVVLAGGTNIGSEYIGPVPRPHRWRDLAFVLKGPAVRYYADVFRYDWKFADGESLAFEEPCVQIASAENSAVVQVVPSGPDVPNDALYDAILSMIFAAKERFWIATPYFVPDDALTQALVLAARRGVDVCILLPKRSNHLLPDMVRGNFLRTIQDAGGTILMYTRGMMHGKMVLMDSHLAVMGSANMDVRSLFLDYEIALLAYGAKEIAAAQAWFEGIAGDCRTGINHASRLQSIFEGVVHLIAPLL